MSIIIDIILILLIAILTYVSYKKGFLASLLDLIGNITAFLVSVFIANLFSVFIYDSIVEKFMKRLLTERLVASADTAVESIVKAIPGFIMSSARTVGINVESILESNSGKELQYVVDSVNTDIIKPIITFLIKAILVLVLYIIFMILIRLLIKLLEKINKLPVIGSLNEFLGIFIGALKGVLVVFILTVIISASVDLSGGNFIFITKDILDNSVIFNIFNSINPIGI